MTLPLSIPTVTSDDLTTFHTHAFGTAPSPHSLPHFPTSPGQTNAHSSHHAQHDDDDDDDGDGLGFYADGRKRTLTDQQIAMFRHSEIYGIVRARQVRRENEDFDDEETSAAASSSKDITQAAPEEEEKSVTAGTGSRAGEGISRLKRRKLNRQRNVEGRGGGDVPSRRVIREMDKPVGGGVDGGELEY